MSTTLRTALILLRCQYDRIVTRNRSSASDFAYSYPFLCSVVRSVVCHIRAPCLNRSPDSDAIWQVHLWGPMTHCVRWGFLAHREGGFGAEPWPKHAISNCSQVVSPMLPPGEHKRGVGWPCYSDSAFCLLLWSLSLTLSNISVVVFLVE